MNDKLIFAIRVSLALVWLYNGLWLKVIAADAHHLEIIQSVFHSSGLDPVIVLRFVGGCETLLAIGILSGLFYRFIAIFQMVVILSMNVAAAIFGGGSIAHPIGLIVSNLPTIMCALTVAIHGPGWAALGWKQQAQGTA